MKIKNNIIKILAGVIIIMSAIVLHTCNRINSIQQDLTGANTTIENINGQYVKYKTEADGTIAIQKQVIVSQEQSIASHLLDIERLKRLNIKEVQSNTILKETISIKNLEIKNLKDSLNNKEPNVIIIDSTKYIEIPFWILKSNDWFGISLKIDYPVSNIEDLWFKNEPIVTVGYRGTGSWFKDIYTRPEAVVVYSNKNPYVNLDAMYNVVIKHEPKFYQTNGFWAGVGFVGGVILINSIK